MGWEAIAKHGPPEIMKTDKRSQFAGLAWKTKLTEAGARISIDMRGRYRDNIFIECWWHSPHQEAIYLEEIRDSFQGQRVASANGWYSTIPRGPMPRLIGERRTTRIEQV